MTKNTIFQLPESSPKMWRPLVGKTSSNLKNSFSLQIGFIWINHRFFVYFDMNFQYKKLIKQ